MSKKLSVGLLASLGFIVIPSGLFAAPAPAVDHTFSTLLLSQNSVWVKSLARSIHANPGHAEQVTDVAAEVLAQSCDKKIGLDIDTQAWVAKALGATQKQRYEAVIRRCIDQVGGKFERHADKALDQLSVAGPSYTAGTVDIAALRGQLASQAAADQRDLPKSLLNEVTVGSDMKDVYQRFGLPDQVKMATGVASYSSSAKVSGWAPVGVRWGARGAAAARDAAPRIIAAYDGFATVQFMQPAHGQWVVESLTGWGMEAAPTGPNAHLISGINAGSAPIFKSTIVDMYKRSVFDQDLLDRVAKRLSINKGNGEAQMIDALSWACKLLGLSSNARYRSVLKDVAENGYHRKLRKYANRGLDDLPSGNVEQYQPGA